MTKEQIAVIIITAIIALVISGVNAAINIRIKFAKTEDHAKTDAILTFAWVFTFALALMSGYFLGREMNSIDGPVTKDSLGSILISSFGVILSLFLVGFLSMTNLIRSLGHAIATSIEEGLSEHGSKSE